jgi:hypothetical protein
MLYYNENYHLGTFVLHYHVNQLGSKLVLFGFHQNMYLIGDFLEHPG